MYMYVAFQLATLANVINCFIVPQIRLSALKVLQETYLSLGEEFMVLLPETVPFLAECMEGEGLVCMATLSVLIATLDVLYIEDFLFGCLILLVNWRAFIPLLMDNL